MPSGRRSQSWRWTVIGLVAAVAVLVVGALTFLPVLALGPIAEQVSIAAGQSF